MCGSAQERDRQETQPQVNATRGLHQARGARTAKRQPHECLLRVEGNSTFQLADGIDRIQGRLGLAEGLRIYPVTPAW